MRSGLHVTELGDQGSPVVFCHGLFGQGKNWTSVAKKLAARHRVLLVDMPNHGRSRWTETLDYLDLAERVAPLLPPDDPVSLVGHSMGGKIAMVLALEHPDLVRRLCVVDIAPVRYPPGREFEQFVAAMRAVDLEALDRRADADAALREAAPDPNVRSFLLQNLRRGDEGWTWLPNLDLFAVELDRLGDWPGDRLTGVAPYEGPVLWISGETSDYVRDEYAEAMTRWFPRTRRVTVKKAGHWVHSEQPATFTAVLDDFVCD